MNGWVLSVLLLTYLTVASGLTVKSYCYADDNNPYLNFGTKSAYEFHHGKEKIVYPPGCKPVYVWLVTRHGTRWGEAGDIEEFIDLLKLRDMIMSNANERRGELCKKDFMNLKEWKFDMAHEQGYMLTEQGQEDLFFLGRRFRSHFPELLESSFDPNKFVVRHTDTARTKESAEYFFKGLFKLGFHDPEPTIHGATSTEHLIYPYRNCPKFDTAGNEIKKERGKFEKSYLMKDVIARVSSRLGFNYNLTIGNIKAIYDGCRYQKAWFTHDVSPWCAAFTFKDLEVLEFNEDIRYYYKSGPGTPINLKLACPVVKDLIDRFTAYEKDPTSQPQGVFYMSHVNLINMMTSRMGIFNQPDPLKPSVEDFFKQKNRKYRASEIVPFMGNLAAVLYSCADGLNVVFYQSERKVMLDGCDDGLCKLSYLRDLYKFTQDPACTDTSFCFEEVPTKPGSGRYGLDKPGSGKLPCDSTGPCDSGARSTMPLSGFTILLVTLFTSTLVYFKN